MKKVFRHLQLQQMDALLGALRPHTVVTRPKTGWTRTIRETLGMSAAALAKRLGISQAGVRKLETAEANDAITLASLRKLARGLDCELHYALIPRTSLAQQIQDRAEAVARAQLQPITHTMGLEDQTAVESATELQFERTVQQLLEGSYRSLW